MTQIRLVRNGVHAVRTCQVCGEEFRAKRTEQRTCSVRCGQLSAREKNLLRGVEERRAVCVECDAEFIRKPNCKDTRFCSKPCVNAYISRRNKGIRFRGDRTYERRCIECGVTFVAAEPQTGYCSTSCQQRRKWRRITSDPELLAAERKRRQRFKEQNPTYNQRYPKIVTQPQGYGRRWYRVVHPKDMGPPALRERSLFGVCTTRRCRQLYLVGVQHVHAERVCVQCGGALAHQQRHLCDTCAPARRKRSSGYAKKVSLERLGELYGWVCALCGGDVPRDLEWDAHDPPALYPSRDHIVPFAMGGSDALSNLQLAHWACNTERRDQPMTHRGGLVAL